MKMNKWALALVGMSIVGCGGGPGSDALGNFSQAKLESEEDARKWTSASAPNIQLVSSVALTAAGLGGNIGGVPLGEIDNQEADPNCPTVKEDGNTIRIEGGCTNNKGVKFTGSAVKTDGRLEVEVGRLTFNDFSVERDSACADGTTGRTTLTFRGFVNAEPDGQTMKFENNLSIEANGLDSETCETRTETVAYEYRSTRKGFVSDALWNGSGRIGNSRDGVVEVETRDEQIDFEACASEASSGTTIIKAGGNTIELKYDGATKCDEESLVPWTLNGTAKGELSGVACAAASGPLLAGWASLCALGLGLLRRRRK